VGDDVREVLEQLVPRNGSQVLPDVLRAVFLHLGQDGLGEQVTGLELVGEPFHVLVEEDGPLSPDGL